MQPDLIQGNVEPDLAITEAALWAEHHKLILELNDIEKANSALRAKIMAKTEEKMGLVAARKLRNMTRDGPRPPP